MAHTSYEEAQRIVLGYANDLNRSVIDGMLNESACEGLLESFIENHLASYQSRSKLLGEALSVINSRKFLSE